MPLLEIQCLIFTWGVHAVSQTHWIVVYTVGPCPKIQNSLASNPAKLYLSICPASIVTHSPNYWFSKNSHGLQTALKWPQIWAQELDSITYVTKFQGTFVGQKITLWPGNDKHDPLTRSRYCAACNNNTSVDLMKYKKAERTSEFSTFTSRGRNTLGKCFPKHMGL